MGLGLRVRVRVRPAAAAAAVRQIVRSLNYINDRAGQFRVIGVESSSGGGRNVRVEYAWFLAALHLLIGS